MFEIQDVNGLDVAFGGDMKKLMPPKEEIPKEFKFMSGNKWNNLVSTWFFNGIIFKKMIPKSGVDAEKAINHVRAIMRSWEPKHEDKESACAYLLSQWFKDIKYESAKGV